MVAIVRPPSPTVSSCASLWITAIASVFANNNSSLFLSIARIVNNQDVVYSLQRQQLKNTIINYSDTAIVRSVSVPSSATLLLNPQRRWLAENAPSAPVERGFSRSANT